MCALPSLIQPERGEPWLTRETDIYTRNRRVSRKETSEMGERLLRGRTTTTFLRDTLSSREGKARSSRVRVSRSKRERRRVSLRTTSTTVACERRSFARRASEQMDAVETRPSGDRTRRDQLHSNSRLEFHVHCQLRRGFVGVRGPCPRRLGV